MFREIKEILSKWMQDIYNDRFLRSVFSPFVNISLHASHYVYTFFEKANNVKLYISPAWIVEAYEFCKDDSVYNILDSVETKMQKDGWVDWKSLKHHDTVYIELVINMYGNTKRFILDKDIGWSILKNDVVYAILREHVFLDNKVNDIDITDLVKEYSNIPIEKLNLDIILNSYGMEVNELNTIELVYSTFDDFDEKTIVLQK